MPVHPLKRLSIQRGVAGARLQVADGQGQGVGGVVLVRGGGQGEQAGDHAGHLSFIGGAVAYHGLFNPARLVFKDRQAGRRSGHQGHPAGLAEDKRGARVLAEKDAFDSHRFGPGFLDHLA